MFSGLMRANRARMGVSMVELVFRIAFLLVLQETVHAGEGARSLERIADSILSQVEPVLYEDGLFRVPAKDIDEHGVYRVGRFNIGMHFEARGGFCYSLGNVTRKGVVTITDERFFVMNFKLNDFRCDYETYRPRMDFPFAIVPRLRLTVSVPDNNIYMKFSAAQIRKNVCMIRPVETTYEFEEDRIEAATNAFFAYRSFYDTQAFHAMRRFLKASTSERVAMYFETAFITSATRDLLCRRLIEAGESVGK